MYEKEEVWERVHSAYRKYHNLIYQVVGRVSTMQCFSHHHLRPGVICPWKLMTEYNLFYQ